MLLSLSGCQSLTSDKILSDIKTAFEKEGYDVQITHGEIIWLTDNGYNVYSPSENLKIIYTPNNTTAYMMNPLDDQEVKKMIFLVKDYFQGKMTPNIKNTYEDKYENINIKYSYSENNISCSFIIPTYISYNEKTKQSNLADIEIGCTNSEEVAKVENQMKPFYDALVGKDSIRSTIFFIDKQEGDFFHINGHAIEGGGWELIVKKEENGYKQLYGGNSGDIECSLIREHEIPKEIYGGRECYEEVAPEAESPEGKAFISIPDINTLSRSSNNAYYIYGSTSDNCKRVIVTASNPTAGILDVYPLKDYRKGSVSFKYGIREDWNNLGVGANTYSFAAYCVNDQVIKADTTLNYTITLPSYKPQTSTYTPTYSPPSTSYYSYSDGYEWAEENDTDNFSDCQSEFGTGSAEDGCNEYVKENYSGYKTFHGYDCTEDCSGHEAGYEWAEENDIDDTYDCDGNSNSFVEGCEAYVDENY